jgi:hypothetical protein
MDRDEILRRNKECNPKDEGVVHIEDRARRYGEVGMCIVFILLILYKLVRGIPANDILALFWAYMGVGSVYKYRACKTKSYLVSAVCGTVAAVAFLLAYVLQTW